VNTRVSSIQIGAGISFATICLAVLPQQPVVAQEAEHEGAIISVQATGSVEVDADHAVLTVGISIQDETPTSAATEMDERLSAITNALVSLGIPRDSLPNQLYQVVPNRDYREGQRIVGYMANSAVRVTIWDMEMLPSVIEAALAAGATDVTNLVFSTSARREAQDEALRRAVSEARRDAEVIAEAAGGRLGSLVEVSTPQSGIVRQAPMERMRVASGPGPEITPRSITVTANVSVRWAFVEN